MKLFSNRITTLLKIEYPIIQAGMIWTSGWRLASAVSNAGGLGVIGSGSMYPEVLREHIQKCKAATSKPFGVNVPLLYPDLEKHIEIIIAEKVPVVITSAGRLLGILALAVALFVASFIEDAVILRWIANIPILIVLGYAAFMRNKIILSSNLAEQSIADKYYENYDNIL